MSGRRHNRGAATDARARQRRRLYSLRRATTNASRSATNVNGTDQQVVDLTCEDATDNDQYVDLTAIDSSTVEILDTPTPNYGSIDDVDGSASLPRPENYSPMFLGDSSDSDSELPAVPFELSTTTRSAKATSETSSMTPTSAIVCPICLDGLGDIKTSGRRVMVTPCGHILCSDCMKSILANGNNKRCPTCRKKLSSKTVHQLFI